MFPNTNDPECQEYIQNELLNPAINRSGICPTELKLLTDALKEDADELVRVHQDEGYLCPVCLVRMETVLGVLRDCKKDVDKEG